MGDDFTDFLSFSSSLFSIVCVLTDNVPQHCGVVSAILPIFLLPPCVLSNSLSIPSLFYCLCPQRQRPLTLWCSLRRFTDVPIVPLCSCPTHFQYLLSSIVCVPTDNFPQHCGVVSAVSPMFLLSPLCSCPIRFQRLLSSIVCVPTDKVPQYCV